MSELNQKDILKLAKLSRLRLSEAELKRFERELNAIIDYVDILNQADTKGLQPTYQVTGLHSVTRPDKVLNYKMSREQLLAGAPNQHDYQFRVKRVIE